MLRVLAHPATAVVGLLISLSLLAWTVSSSWFLSDDFLNFARASQMGFWQWVNEELFGHWLPARKTLDWGLNASRPISWPATVALLLEFVGLASLLARLVVLRLSRSGAWANIALVALPIACAIPGTAQWWAGAAQVIPAMVCTCAVLLGVVWLPAVTGLRRAAVLVGIAAALAAGVLFDERTAVIAMLSPALLPLVSTGRHLRVGILLSYATMIPLLGAWVLLQSRLTGGTDGELSDPATIVVFIAKSVVQNAVPSLFGWVTRPAVWGEDLLWGVGIVLIALIALLVGRATSRGRAAWALLVWLAAVVLTAAPTALVRAGQFGVSSALEPRYIVMAMPLGMIVLAYVLSLGRRPGRVVGTVGAALAAVLSVCLAANLIYLHANTMGMGPRAWAQQLAQSAADQNVEHFYNAPVPGFIIPAAFYPYNLTGAVVPQIVAGADTVVTEREAGWILADGSVEVISPELLVEATLTQVEGFAEAPEGESGCYTAGEQGGRLSFDFPGAGSDGIRAVSVSGEFPARGVRMVAGPSWDSLRDKTAGIGGSAPVPGSALWVTTEEFADSAVLGIDVEAGQAVCIDAVEIGLLPVPTP